MAGDTQLNIAFKVAEFNEHVLHCGMGAQVAPPVRILIRLDCAEVAWHDLCAYDVVHALPPMPPGHRPCGVLLPMPTA